MSPNAGERVVGCGVSANEYNRVHHVTWSPNEPWRSNSIFNLCSHLIHAVEGSNLLAAEEFYVKLSQAVLKPAGLRVLLYTKLNEFPLV
jgi:hypothetical protein